MITTTALADAAEAETNAAAQDAEAATLQRVIDRERSSLAYARADLKKAHRKATRLDRPNGHALGREQERKITEERIPAIEARIAEAQEGIDHYTADAARLRTVAADYRAAAGLATIDLPAPFCEWLDGTGLALGQDDTDPECKETRLAYEAATYHDTHQTITATRTVLRLLAEYADNCIDGNVNGREDAEELAAAEAVATRAAAALRTLKTAQATQEAPAATQAQQEQQEAPAAPQEAITLDAVRYERRTGGDGTGEFHSTTEYAVWVRREIESAQRRGLKITTRPGLITIEGERPVKFLPLADEDPQGFDPTDPATWAQTPAGYEWRETDAETGEQQLFAPDGTNLSAALPAPQGVYTTEAQQTAQMVAARPRTAAVTHAPAAPHQPPTGPVLADWERDLLAAAETPQGAPVTVEWTHSLHGHDNGRATLNGTTYQIVHVTHADADRGALGDHLAYALTADGQRPTGHLARTWGLRDLLAQIATHAGITGPLDVTHTGHHRLTH